MTCHGRPSHLRRPKIVTLCGSSRFVDVMAVCAWLIERDENAIALALHLLPRWYPNCPADHLAEAEGCAEQMDELHKRKIDLCDEIFVINLHDYIGDSTRSEIAYARATGKPVRFFDKDQIGRAVLQMLGRPR
jgi:nucleoside 2-deoxyribosyltransferase